LIRDTVSNFRRKLQGKIVAYNHVFDHKNVFTHDVLKDLARFCRAHDSTFHKDPRIHAMLEGRREVWLRIQEMLQLDMEEIYSLHKIKELEPVREIRHVEARESATAET
jgi:hypothetical protein